MGRFNRGISFAYFLRKCQWKAHWEGERDDTRFRLTAKVNLLQALVYCLTPSATDCNDPLSPEGKSLAVHFPGIGHTVFLINERRTPSPPPVRLIESVRFLDAIGGCGLRCAEAVGWNRIQPADCRLVEDCVPALAIVPLRRWPTCGWA